MLAATPPELAVLAAVVAGRAAETDVRGWDAARWDAVLDAAEWHRLAPLLARWCATRPDVPAATRERLDAAYLANAARNMYVMATLRRVIAALDGAGVPAMTLKGAALLECAYPDPALRELLDLDVLVPDAALGDARAALEAIGFAAGGPDGAALHAADHHDAALVGESAIVAVELHRHIALAGEGASLDVEAMWERGRPASGGASHLIPSAEDLLLHVCVHFMRNRLGGSHGRVGTGGALAQLRDVAEILEHHDADWARLAAIARAAGLDARVHLALYAAREIGVAVPDEALAQLEPPGFDAAVGRRLVMLRVLRAGPQLAVRSLRLVVAPGRDVLEHGYDGRGTGAALARAYVRRALAKAPLARAALRRPRTLLQDYRLNGEIRALEQRR